MRPEVTGSIPISHHGVFLTTEGEGRSHINPGENGAMLVLKSHWMTINNAGPMLIIVCNIISIAFDHVALWAAEEIGESQFRVLEKLGISRDNHLHK
jgi:hypothetical protein